MATSANIQEEQVRVYALANPVLLKQEESVIERIFFETLGVSDRGRYKIEISESSGWISFVDLEELWRKKTPPQLPEGSVARRKADEFLRKLIKAMSPSNTRLPESLRAMALFPVNDPVEIVKVPRPDGSMFDHWLYRLQPKLVFGRNQRRSVTVLGTQIELRIGEGGQIIGYQSRWRPVTSERIYTAFMPFDPRSVERDNRTRNEEAPPHSPVYVLEGDGIPQYYLAPYYLVNEGHALSLQSASAYSLTVDIGQLDTEEGTLLTALVRGGSGSYIFGWAVYSLDTVLDEGYRDLGSGESLTLRTDFGEVRASRVTLRSGAYIVMVNVKDRRTGAFKHHQQQVYSRPLIDEPPNDLVASVTPVDQSPVTA